MRVELIQNALKIAKHIEEKYEPIELLETINQQLDAHHLALNKHLKIEGAPQEHKREFY